MEAKDLDRLYLLVAILVGVLVYIAPHALSQTGPAANYRNVTVATTLNITNSFPEILNVTVDSPITLNAGSTTSINCNVTVRDFDGVSDINNVNTTFFDQLNTTLNAADDDNNHYTNTSCSLTGNNSNTANYTCTFQAEYYANNGTQWNCTAFVNDTSNEVGNGSVLAEISALLALNVTVDTIDYGNLAVTDISAIQPANVTNFGNVPINVTVYGYGSTIGDGLAMVCDQGNIPIDEERFSLNATDVWANMNPLSATNQNITNLTIVKRTNNTANDIFNTTYWRMRVPASSNPSGQCNGSIVFQAEAS